MGFKPGQRVKVEFEARVLQHHKDDVGTWNLQLTDDNGLHRYVRAEDATNLDPAHWPPRVGDVWEAEGNEYVCYHGRYSGGVLIRRTHDEYNDEVYNSTNPALLDTFKALNPTLVRRRGVAL